MPGIHIEEAPRFLKTPASVLKMTEGSSLKLECIISGNPVPRVTWSKNDVLLESSHRIKIKGIPEKRMLSFSITS